MDLRTAIKVTRVLLRERKPYSGSVGNDALKLGIEALKRLDHYRKRNPDLFFALLPGETKD